MKKFVDDGTFLVYHYKGGYVFPLRVDGDLAHVHILDYGMDYVRTTWVFKSSIGGFA